MGSPTRKNRRRKKDDINVLDETDSTILKTVKKEVNTRKRRKKDTSDEEEDGRLSIESSAKREAQPVHSSSEVLELRQHLILARQEKVNAEQQAVNTAQLLLNSEQQAVQKEEMYQSQIREAVQRAERAEKERGSKRGVASDDSKKKELKKEVKDLTKQLGKQEKRANKKIDKLTNELEEEKNRANEWEKIHEKSMNDLTKQLEQEREGRKRADNEVARLRLKLAKFVHSDKAQAPETTMEDDAGRTGPVVHSSAQLEPRNILLLLNSSSKNAMPMEEGVEKVNAAFNKCTLRTLNRLKDKAWYGNCAACGVEVPNKLVVTTHFLSEEHIEKVHSLNASASRFAVTAWAHTLDQIEEKAKQRN